MLAGYTLLPGCGPLLGQKSSAIWGVGLGFGFWSRVQGSGYLEFVLSQNVRDNFGSYEAAIWGRGPYG